MIDEDTTLDFATYAHTNTATNIILFWLAEERKPKNE